MREFIGLLSIGIGVALLIVSLYLTLRRIRARLHTPLDRAALATVIYGLLFVAVGMIIEYTQPAAPKIEKVGLPGQATTKASPDTIPLQRERVKEDTIQVREQIAATQEPQSPTGQEGKRTQRSIRARERVQPARPQITPEDRIYTLVDAVLRKIEDFFEQYGTPVGMVTTPSISLRLPPIFFDDTTADIPPKYLPLLDETARRIRQSPGTDVIEVQAHTNGEGPEVYNFLVTQSRANAARDYLVTRGVQSNRLVAKGYGTTMPCPAVSDSTQRHSNRRIEFVPLSEMRTVQK